MVHAPRTDVCNVLSARGALLDAGCGPGNKARELVDMGMCVHGFDFSEEMARLARQAVKEQKEGDLAEKVVAGDEYATPRSGSLVFLPWRNCRNTLPILAARW